MNSDKRILIGPKSNQYYKGILIKADLGLHEQISMELLNRFPPNPKIKILDLGAGEGALSLRLSELGYQVYSSDVDEKSFKCPSIPFFKLDFNKSMEIVDFQKNFFEYFDIVMGIETIEHLENPWEFIRFLKKLVKSGGTIIITTPNIASWYSRLEFLFWGTFHQFNNEDLKYGHVAPISPWELQQIFEKEGLKNISLQPGGVLPDIWLVNYHRWLVLNALSFIIRPFMKGIARGWCVIATGEK